MWPLRSFLAKNKVSTTIRLGFTDIRHVHLRGYLGVALQDFPQGKKFCSDPKTIVFTIEKVCTKSKKRIQIGRQICINNCATASNGCASLETQFFAIYTKTKHFKVYVASQHLYKCGHCGHFKLKMKSLRPSHSDLRVFTVRS